MKRRAAVFALLCWAALAGAQPADLPARLTIERSTSPAPLGQRATLTLSPLKRRGDRFVGSYQMKIAPIGLASESGSLEVKLSPDALRRNADRKPVEFSGTAANDAGKPRTIKGVATPADAQSGAVQLEIHSERGTLHFNTRYQLP